MAWRRTSEVSRSLDGAEEPAKGLEIERRGLCAHADSRAGARAAGVIANLQ